MCEFVHEFKYEIHTNSNSYELFAGKIVYVTNGLYCMMIFFSGKSRSKYTVYLSIIVWLIFDHVIFAIFYSIV